MRECIFAATFAAASESWELLSVRECILACGDLGEASWAPCVSQGLVGVGVGREVSDSRQKAELKPLWRRALPAAALRGLLGKLPCYMHYCEITNHKRILNWFFFVLFFSFLLLFNVGCYVGQNKEPLSGRYLTSLAWCFHTLFCVVLLLTPTPSSSLAVG